MSSSYPCSASFCVERNWRTDKPASCTRASLLHESCERFRQSKREASELVITRRLQRLFTYAWKVLKLMFSHQTLYTCTSEVVAFPWMLATGLVSVVITILQQLNFRWTDPPKTFKKVWYGASDFWLWNYECFRYSDRTFISSCNVSFPGFRQKMFVNKWWLDYGQNHLYVFSFIT